jgi:hypothetical protein
MRFDGSPARIVGVGGIVASICGPVALATEAAFPL